MKQTAGNLAEVVEVNRRRSPRTLIGAAKGVGATRVTAESVPRATVVVSQHVADQVTVGNIAVETDAAIEDSARRSHWSNTATVQNVCGGVTTAKRLSGGTAPNDPRCHRGSERSFDRDRGLEKKKALTSAPGLGP